MGLCALWHWWGRDRDCGKYKEVREKCFDQLSNLMPQFSSSAEMNQMQMSLGERLIHFSKIHQSAILIHVCFTHAMTRKTNYNIYEQHIHYLIHYREGFYILTLSAGYIQQVASRDCLYRWVIESFTLTNNWFFRNTDSFRKRLHVYSEMQRLNSSEASFETISVGEAKSKREHCVKHVWFFNIIFPFFTERLY